MNQPVINSPINRSPLLPQEAEIAAMPCLLSADHGGILLQDPSLWTRKIPYPKSHYDVPVLSLGSFFGLESGQLQGLWARDCTPTDAKVIKKSKSEGVQIERYQRHRHEEQHLSLD